MVFLNTFHPVPASNVLSVCWGRAGLSIKPLLDLNGQELPNTDVCGHKATVEFWPCAIVNCLYISIYDTSNSGNLSKQIASCRRGNIVWGAKIFICLYIAQNYGTRCITWDGYLSTRQFVLLSIQIFRIPTRLTNLNLIIHQASTHVIYAKQKFIRL